MALTQQTNNMQLTTEQVNTLIESGKKQGITGKAVIDGLIERGFEPQGVDIEGIQRSKAREQVKIEDEALTEEREGLGLEGDDTTFAEPLEDITQAGEGISEALEEGAEKSTEIAESTIEGEQSLASGALQFTGEAVSTTRDIFGEFLKGGVKVILKPEEEKQLAEFIDTTLTKAVTGYKGINEGKVGRNIDTLVSQYADFREKNPELAKNLEAGAQIVEGIIDVATLGLAGKVKSKLFGKFGKGVSEAAEDIAGTVAKGEKGVKDLIPERRPSTGVTKKELEAGIRPDIKKSIQGESEALKEYFDVTQKRLADETAQTPTGLLVNKADDAFNQVEKQLAETGSAIGENRVKVGNTKVPQSEAAKIVDGFDSELGKLNLVVDEKGVIKKGKGIVDVSDAEIKVLNELREDALRVSADPKVQTIQAFKDKLDNRINFGKSSGEVSGVIDPLNREIRAITSQVNKTQLGELAASQYTKYSELKNFLKETRAIERNPQAILRRLFSADNARGLEFAGTIEELTGINLVKESRFAKIAAETFAKVNPELGTRLQQVIGDGLGATDIIAKIPGGGGAISSALKFIGDIPKEISRQSLLRRGIDPAIIEAEKTMNIILNAAK